MGKNGPNARIAKNRLIFLSLRWENICPRIDCFIAAAHLDYDFGYVSSYI